MNESAHFDLVVIGGGPGGMAAALGAKEAGLEPQNVLILDREKQLGGILVQCIHNGFGLHRFGRELTGPEYAGEYIAMVEDAGIPYKLETMVLEIENHPENHTKTITAINSVDGIFRITAKAVVLAMGCRERSRGALNIPGTRPAGVYTAGTAQKYVNLKGYMPGKEVVILGSGDIGLIMARRMTLEGASVKAVCEIMPYSGGLTRNIVQCLEDFYIPLKLSYTVAEIHGKERVEGVTIGKVDSSRRIIPGTEEYIPCDTLLLSVGLIPENELSKEAGVAMDSVTGGPLVDQHRQTSIQGVFACGNVLQVHDLVDYVSEEGAIAGRCAGEYVLKGLAMGNTLPVVAGKGVKYVVPEWIRQPLNEDIRLYFRVDGVYLNQRLEVICGEKKVYSKAVRKLTPGEMESVIIKKEDITGPLSVRVGEMEGLENE